MTTFSLKFCLPLVSDSLGSHGPPSYLFLLSLLPGWSYLLCVFSFHTLHISMTPFPWKLPCLPETLFECHTGTHSKCPQPKLFFSYSPFLKNSLYSLPWWMASLLIQLSMPETWAFTQVIPSLVPLHPFKDLLALSYPLSLHFATVHCHLRYNPLTGFSPFTCAPLQSSL